MSTVDTLHIYVDPQLKYRWSFVAANGKVLADSGQGYTDVRDARRGFSIINRVVLPRVPLYQSPACDRHNNRPCLVWQILRRDDHTIAAEALRRFTPRCPVHGIPDCSPLLNGCRLPEYLHNQLEEAALEHDQRSKS